MEGMSAVSNELAGFLSGGSESHAEYGVVESGLEHYEEVFTRDALLCLSLDKVVVELRLLQSVESLCLLLFS